MPAETPPVLVNSAASGSADTRATAADVVAKALAFKPQLTTAQQATLEKPYTAQLARCWSNLLCGANCRNGIQLSTLTAAQLSAALAVIQAAAGTATSEGYSEFNQIRLADDFLGANGGGSGYSGSIYFLAFLNTPTTTGGWMLQFGGHHYAANIAYNNTTRRTSRTITAASSAPRRNLKLSNRFPLPQTARLVRRWRRNAMR